MQRIRCSAGHLGWMWLRWRLDCTKENEQRLSHRRRRKDRIVKEEKKLQQGMDIVQVWTMNQVRKEVQTQQRLRSCQNTLSWWRNKAFTGRHINSQWWKMQTMEPGASFFEECASNISKSLKQLVGEEFWAWKQVDWLAKQQKQCLVEYWLSKGVFQ